MQIQQLLAQTATCSIVNECRFSLIFFYFVFSTYMSSWDVSSEAHEASLIRIGSGSIDGDMVTAKQTA